MRYGAFVFHHAELGHYRDATNVLIHVSLEEPCLDEWKKKCLENDDFQTEQEEFLDVMDAQGKIIAYNVRLAEDDKYDRAINEEKVDWNAGILFAPHAKEPFVTRDLRMLIKSTSHLLHILCLRKD
jgi:hypothetical protein